MTNTCYPNLLPKELQPTNLSQKIYIPNQLKSLKIPEPQRKLFPRNINIKQCYYFHQLILSQYPQNTQLLQPQTHMKFSLHCPDQGTTKSIVIDNSNSWRHFLEKRIGQEVEADGLGQQFKGYVFKITGGFDGDGFAMKQGIFSNGRIRLLLSPGATGYRATRKGERKRRSVRGCIVGPDIKMLSCIITKKGEKQIPGLTDETRPRKLGPKRASKVRKLYGIAKQDGVDTHALIKKNVIRRTFKGKKNPAADRQKAPKIQRLVTDIRIRRKRIQKDAKIKRWKRTLAATEEYKKLLDKWVAKKKAAAHNARVAARKASQAAEKQEKPTEKVPAKKEKRVQVKGDSKVGGGAKVVAAVTKTQKVVKKKAA